MKRSIEKVRGGREHGQLDIQSTIDNHQLPGEMAKGKPKESFIIVSLDTRVMGNLGVRHRENGRKWCMGGVEAVQAGGKG